MVLAYHGSDASVDAVRERLGWPRRHHRFDLCGRARVGNEARGWSTSRARRRALAADRITRAATSSSVREYRKRDVVDPLEGRRLHDAHDLAGVIVTLERGEHFAPSRCSLGSHHRASVGRW
jgi:hypothetical protein